MSQKESFPLILDESLHARIFKTDGFNWSNGYICGAHWNSDGRKSPEDLPDIALPVDQYELTTVKYSRYFLKILKILLRF